MPIKTLLVDTADTFSTNMKRARSPTPPMPEHLKVHVMYVPLMMVATGGPATPTVPMPVTANKPNTSEVVLKATATVVRMCTSPVAAQKTATITQEMRRAKIESQKQKLQDAVEKYDLNYIEELLVRGCYSVLDVPVEHIAQMCKASRISEEEVRAHATEIGVDKKLTVDMVWNIVKFVQFMYLVEKLKIVQFGTAIAGRSVLGYMSIKIKMSEEWESIICSICGFRNYFQAFSTLYEMMLKFGFGMSREGKLPEHAVKGTSTQNKTNALLFCDTLSFEEDKLASNLKRYTNQQTKPKETSDGINLLALATVAEKELK